MREVERGRFRGCSTSSRLTCGRIRDRIFDARFRESLEAQLTRVASPARFAVDSRIVAARGSGVIDAEGEAKPDDRGFAEGDEGCSNGEVRFPFDARAR